ncbi:MAG TPA: LuxR C-terminal-related transcriptional regulator, partial [Acidimicrobiales bacterium]|nr:LuxR C-terminal-related transcriptional regulator [Acidimicrobiales bacterium]
MEPAGTWPLVGRAEELTFLRRAIVEQAAPALCIAGGPGIGKTRLAREIVSEVGGAGFATEWVAATQSSAAIAFGPFARFVPPADAAFPATALLVSLRGALTSAAQRHGGSPVTRGLLLVVDDAHLLDDASATLVHELVIAGEARVLLTLRAGSPLPDAIAALIARGSVGYVELQALSYSEVHAMLEAVLDGPVDPEASGALWSRCQGNALFLHELISAVLAAEAVVWRAGLWHLTGPLTISPRLAEVIELRLRELGDAGRTVVECLALLEPLSLEILQAVSSPQAVSEAERAGYLDIHADGQRLDVRLHHPLYAESARATMPLTRKREMVERLTDALEATGCARDDELLRSAALRVESGLGIDAPSAVRTGRLALAFGDNPLAERVADAGLASSPSDLSLLLLRAQALHSQGRYAEAEEILDRASSTAPMPDEPGSTERVRVVTLRAWNLFLGLSRLDDAEAVIANARERAPLGSAAAGALGALEVQLAAYGGRPEEAVRLGRVMLCHDLDPEAELQVMVALIPALAVRCRGEEGLALTERCLALLQERGAPPPEVGRFNGFQAMLYGTMLRYDEAFAVAEQCYNLASAFHALDGAARWAFSLGRLHLGQGHPRSALRWLDESSGILGQLDTTGQYAWALAAGSQARSLLGETDLARAALAAAEHAIGPGSALYGPELRRAGSWLAAASGERRRAADLALTAADEAATRGQLRFAILCFHDAARFGRAEEAAEGLRPIVPEDQGPAAALYADHAVGLREGDSTALTAVARRFHDAGEILFAAEAAAESAALLRRDGERARAYAQAEWSRELAAHCEGAVTPALELAGDAALLTGREREVAAQAAAGLTNRAIAATLGVSVRTVENHLYQCFIKLGVSDRSEL